jgi:iron complex transport system substrate-binding protein
MNDRRSRAGTPDFPDSGKRALLFAATLCLGVLPVVACVDDARRPALSHPAQRIVSLVPAATEVLLALGVADRIVGRTDYDTDPRIAHVATLGRTMRASSEAVLARHPDLVIDATYARWAAPSEVRTRARAATFTTDLQTYADILLLIDTLGALVGARQRAAALRIELMRAATELRRTTPTLPPAALYLVWPNPPRTISSTSYLNDVLELAGMRNAFPELRGAWPELSLEVVLQRDPEYIVLATDDAGSSENLRQVRGWRDLSAVRARRIIEVPAGLFHRPGPHVIDAARWLRSALQQRTGQQ